MIRRLQLVNFRSYADATLPLQPISVLVGPVGAGKSNVFKAMVLLQSSLRRRLRELFPPGMWEFQLVRNRLAADSDPIAFEVELDDLEGFPGEQAIYTLSIADAPAGLYVLRETLQRRSGEEPAQWVFERGNKRRFMAGFGDVDPHETPTLLNLALRPGDSAPPQVKFARAVAKALSRIAYYHLEVSELKSLGRGQHVEKLDYYGGALPDFLGTLRTSDAGTEVFETIKRELCELLPDLTDIIITQPDVDRQGLALSFDKHRGYIAAPELSDGTLLTLGLLCIIHGPRRPALLCLEEPEGGLHPGRLRWLFERLVELAYPSSGKPPVQVLLSTHSPYVLDFFRDMQSSVLVVERRDGHTCISPLPEIQARMHNVQEGQGIGHEWAAGLYENL